jgi:hypothetical protein
MSVVGLLSTIAVSAAPAHAAGKTGVYNGCYAQWWNTAVAGYCNNTPGWITVRLVVDCKLGNGHALNWHSINGTAAPFEHYECSFAVTSGALEFR